LLGIGCHWLQRPRRADPFTIYLIKLHHSFQVIKSSFVTSLMSTLTNLMGKFTKPSDMGDELRNRIGKTTFVWSNVPGPAIPVFICGNKVTELQCLVSNPFTMMQSCSYNGMVYTSIQVDTRTATQCEKLSEAYIQTMEAAIAELLVGEEQESASKTLKEAASKHRPGPYLSSFDV